MESIRLPRNKEIDFLAVKLSEDGKKVLERLHIEVQVANRFANYVDSPQEIAKNYHKSKFLDVRPNVCQILGSKYRMIEVRGKMAYRNNDIRETYIKLREKKNVEVIPFEKILKEVQDQLITNSQLNSAVQALQLVKFQLG